MLVLWRIHTIIRWCLMNDLCDRLSVLWRSSRLQKLLLGRRHPSSRRIRFTSDTQFHHAVPDTHSQRVFNVYTALRMGFLWACLSQMTECDWTATQCNYNHSLLLVNVVKSHDSVRLHKISIIITELNLNCTLTQSHKLQHSIDLIIQINQHNIDKSPLILGLLLSWYF